LRYGFTVSLQGLPVRQVQVQVKEVVACTRHTLEQQKPALEKESGIEAVALDCGHFYRLTGCGEGEGDKGNIKLSSRVITSFLRRKKTNDPTFILC